MMRKGHKEDAGTTAGFVITVLTIIATTMYSFVTPLYQIPDWCLDEYNDPTKDYYQKDDGFLVSCQDGDLGKIPLSGTGYINNDASCSFDIGCQIFYIYLQIRLIQRRNMTKPDERRVYILMGFLVLSLVDTVISLAREDVGWYITDFLRPWVVGMNFRSIRGHFSLFWLNGRDSFVTLVILFAFMFYSAEFAHLLFYTTFEGVALTHDLNISYMEIIILYSTENYPDFVLLAYDQEWYTVFFFYAFIVGCIFFMGSILTAIVFENYKRRVAEKRQEKLDERLTYVTMFYDQFDEERLGYLTYK